MKQEKIGSWADDECFYVSIVDGPRFALMAGPFRTHQEALNLVDKANDIGREIDPASHFYGWGTVKMANGYRTGRLNKELGLTI